MAKTKKLPKNARLILVDLCRARRPLPVKQIAERNDIHWKTANENIKRLEKSRLVKCTRSKNRTMCEPSKAVQDKCRKIRRG